MSNADRLLPAQKIRQSSFFTAGLALFSMFFGAGNLVFPLLIGQSTGGNIWFAIGGLGITAVVVPFLGLITMVLFQASNQSFFGRIGRVPGMLLLLLLQMILGPFGVIPRLITLMHALAAPYLLNISLGWFSALTVAILFVCSFKKDQLIRFLGIGLTPILLLSLAILVSVGLLENSSFTISAISAKESFVAGLLGGYNTMDLIAAFLFATVVLPHFQKEMDLESSAQKRSYLIKKVCFASLIAAPLLLLTYIGLCLVSAQHMVDSSVLPEQMLSAIALKLLGPFGVAIAVIAVMTACLTTAMTLVAVFSDYLRKDLFKGKMDSVSSLSITLLIALLFSTLGFQQIIGFLGPILQIVYPGLIVLTVLNLYHFFYGFNRVKVPVFLVFGGAFVTYLIQRFF